VNFGRATRGWRPPKSRPAAARIHTTPTHPPADSEVCYHNYTAPAGKRTGTGPCALCAAIATAPAAVRRLAAGLPRSRRTRCATTPHRVPHGRRAAWPRGHSAPGCRWSALATTHGHTDTRFVGIANSGHFAARCQAGE
jgi:hypothetical protein